METEQKQKLTAFQEQVFFYHKNRAKTERFHLQTEQNRIFHFPLCNRNQNQNRVLEFLDSVFFLTISPSCLGLCYLRALKLASFLSLSEILQDQGSGYSLRMSSCSLCEGSPLKITSKCCGWSNLVMMYKMLLKKHQLFGRYHF